MKRKTVFKILMICLVLAVSSCGGEGVYLGSDEFLESHVTNSDMVFWALIIIALS